MHAFSAFTSSPPAASAHRLVVHGQNPLQGGIDPRLRYHRTGAVE